MMTPNAVKAKPATRLGHGLTLGELAVMTNEAMAHRMPAATQTQAKTRIRAAF
jgi:hypothetical protein